MLRLQSFPLNVFDEISTQILGWLRTYWRDSSVDTLGFDSSRSVYATGLVLLPLLSWFNRYAFPKRALHICKRAPCIYKRALCTRKRVLCIWLGDSRVDTLPFDWWPRRHNTALVYLPLLSCFNRSFFHKRAPYILNRGLCTCKRALCICTGDPCIWLEDSISLDSSLSLITNDW